MVVIGCGGLALQMLHDIESVYDKKKIIFFDNVTNPPPNAVFDYKVLHTIEALELFFTTMSDFSYCLGLSGGRHRHRLTGILDALGGKLTGVISRRGTEISTYASIGEGVSLLPKCLIEPAATIGKGALLNAGCFIHHNVTIGDFCEIGPGAKVLGNVSVGNFTMMGANAVILPKITIGSGCTIGAGAVVTKNIPDNTTVVGIPARPLLK